WFHATLLGQAGRLEEAIRFAERASHRRPETAQYTWTWVDLLLQAHRAAEAEAPIAELLAGDPSAPTALLAARVSIERGQLALARGRLALALALGANVMLVEQLGTRIEGSEN